MKRIVFTLAALLVMTLPFQASAMTTDARKSLVLDKGTDVQGVYAASGGTVDLPNHFFNDVYIAGGTITISGVIDGDLSIAGGTVRVTGEVKGGLRVFGGTVEATGKVGRNVVLVGGTLSTSSTSDVSGSIIVLGGAITLDGHVTGTVDAWTDALTINGRVDGTVTAHFSSDTKNSDAQQLVLGSTSVLGADVQYFAKNDLDQHPGAVVKGKITKGEPSAFSALAKNQWVRIFNFVRLWNLFSLLVVAALVALVFPKSLRRVAATMNERRGRSVALGALFLFASPVAFVILPFTIIGLPLMLILVGLYMIALYVSQIFLGYALGSWLLRVINRGKTWSLSEKPSGGLVTTIFGIVVVSIVFDFLLGASILPAGLSMIVSFAHFVLTLWAFGGLLLEKGAYIKQHELS